MTYPSSASDPAALRAQAADALRAGDKPRARDLLAQAIRLNPADDQNWLWLSGAVETDDERRRCLERALLLNPNNQAARRGLALLAAGPAAPASVPASPPLDARSADAPTLPGRLATRAAEPTPPPAPSARPPADVPVDSLASLRPSMSSRSLRLPRPALIAAAGLAVVVLGYLVARFAFGLGGSAPTAALPTAAATATPTPTRTPTAVPPTRTPTPLPSPTPTPAGVTPAPLPTSDVPAAAELIEQGLAQMQQKDYRAAIASFTAALGRDPESADAFFNRGLARAASGDHRGAIVNYEHVL